jgi:SAM-dependent methyltransferase
MGRQSSFDALIREASEAPVQGWDFSWLEGRATEERPSWHYFDLVARRAESSHAMLDLQCGGGEMLSRLPTRPSFLVATEGWQPNAVLASRELGRRGGFLVEADTDEAFFPFSDASFDLVTSRHPISTNWDEVARVLETGGTFLSQQVGPHSVGELTEFLMGPQPRGSFREPRSARAQAEDAGLRVVDLRSERPRCVFNDIGAVVYFLRLVIWIVPDFTVDTYRDRLLALHERIERDGPFRAHSARFLIEATKAS